MFVSSTTAKSSQNWKFCSLPLEHCTRHRFSSRFYILVYTHFHTLVSVLPAFPTCFFLTAIHLSYIVEICLRKFVIPLGRSYKRGNWKTREQEMRREWEFAQKEEKTARRDHCSLTSPGMTRRRRPRQSYSRTIEHNNGLRVSSIPLGSALKTRRSVWQMGTHAHLVYWYCNHSSLTRAMMLAKSSPTDTW